MEYPVAYKYRDWKSEYSKNCLLKNEFYLPTPAELNDPFDCKIPYDFTLLKTDHQIEQFCRTMLDSIPLNTNTSYRHKLRELIADFKKNTVKFANEYDRVERNAYNINYSVFSLSTVWDNLLLWSHYADAHKGICIGLDTKKIYDIKSKGLPFFGAGGIVDYSVSLPSINPLDSVLNIAKIKTFSKANDWQYEQEFRFLTIWPQPNPVVSQKRIRFENDVIVEVLLGLSISKENELAISKICESKGWPVHKVKRLPRHYRVTR